jgi:hypothetical protein
VGPDNSSSLLVRGRRANYGQQRQEPVIIRSWYRRSRELWPPDLGRGRQGQWSSSLPTWLPRALRALANDAVGHLGRTSPPHKLGAVAATRQRSSFSSAVPPTCHKQRYAAVSHGHSDRAVWLGTRL